MKFWKLQINGNDFLLFYRNHKKINKLELCSERMGAGAHGWIEVGIHGENIRVKIFGENGESSHYFLDGIRCCAYWYMKLYEKQYCVIQYEERSFRLKCYKNLITLEVEPFMDCDNIKCRIKDAMHFQVEDETQSNPISYIQAYNYGYEHHLLHKIAMGEDSTGCNLMRYANDKIYISAPVHMIFEGKIIN